MTDADIEDYLLRKRRGDDDDESPSYVGFQFFIDGYRFFLASFYTKYDQFHFALYLGFHWWFQVFPGQFLHEVRPVSLCRQCCLFVGGSDSETAAVRWHSSVWHKCVLRSRDNRLHLNINLNRLTYLLCFVVNTHRRHLTAVLFH